MAKISIVLATFAKETAQMDNTFVAGMLSGMNDGLCLGKFHLETETSDVATALKTTEDGASKAMRLDRESNGFDM